MRDFIVLMTTETLCFEENSRPDFLGGLEYDLYLPNKHVAFEFNGDQHYVDTKSFGKCASQLQRDSRKRDLSRKFGIRLFVVEAWSLNVPRIKGMMFQAKFKGISKSIRENNDALDALEKRAAEYRSRLKKAHPEATTVFNPRGRDRMIADVLAGRYDNAGYLPGDGEKNWLDKNGKARGVERIRVFNKKKAK